MVSEISRMTELGEKKIRDLVRSFDNDELFLVYDEVQNQMYERFGRIDCENYRSKDIVADNRKGDTGRSISAV